MKDRRNFYRVLYLQPDAPPELVRTHFRALMTKLSAHPDLGGEHWSAAHLNLAYATLRDPEKRAAYDIELLEQFDIKTLSLGRKELKRPVRSVFRPRDPNQDERNYYRLLGVQIDAPLPIIEATCATLKKNATIDPTLLEEAFAVLGNVKLRAKYDELVTELGHVGAIDAIRCRTTNEAKAGTTRPKPPAAPSSALVPIFEPRISRYCSFCKTPFPANRSDDFDCLECASPLVSPTSSLNAAGRRAIGRTDRDDSIEICLYWPDPVIPGRLLDLSPTGLNCMTVCPIEVGDCVKINARQFTAVGEVAHADRVADETRAGVRFLTVRFQEARGSFVSIDA